MSKESPNNQNKKRCRICGSENMEYLADRPRITKKGGIKLIGYGEITIMTNVALWHCHTCNEIAFYDIPYFEGTNQTLTTKLNNQELDRI